MFTNGPRAASQKSIFIHCHTPAIFQRGNEALYAQQGVVCALLFAAAIETLAHDLVAFYEQINGRAVMHFNGDHPANNYMAEDEVALLGKLVSAESKRASVSRKLAIMRDQDPENGIDDPDFNLLVLTRNRIAHLSPEATELDASGCTTDGRPKVLAQLSDKGLTRKLEHNEGWIEALETPAFCAWCKSTAQNVIRDTVAKLPKTQNSAVFIRMLR